MNPAAKLPTWLVFAWPSILSTFETIEIIFNRAASVGLPLLMQFIDLKSWLRMFAVSDAEQCKFMR